MYIQILSLGYILYILLKQLKFIIVLLETVFLLKYFIATIDTFLYEQ